MPWIAFRLSSSRSDAIACVPQDAAIETSEALCPHLLLSLRSWASSLSGPSSRVRSSLARAHAVGGAVAGDQEVPAPIVLAAHHDMAMRMTGIEVIRGNPSICSLLVLVERERGR